MKNFLRCLIVDRLKKKKKHKLKLSQVHLRQEKRNSGSSVEKFKRKFREWVVQKSSGYRVLQYVQQITLRIVTTVT